MRRPASAPVKVLDPPTSAPQRPRSLLGWYTIGVAFLSLFVSASAGGFAFSILLPAMHDELGWSRSAIVFGSGISGVVAALAGPPLGRLIDQGGLRRIMIVSILSLGGSLAASGLAVEPWEFYAAYGLVCGVARSALSSVAPGVLLANWFVRRRAKAFGIAAVGPPASNLVLPPILAVVVNAFGWRAGWFAMGISVVVFSLGPTLFVRARPEEAGLGPDGEVLEQSHMAVPDRHPPYLSDQDWPAHDAFHSAIFWVLAIGLALILLAPNVTVVFAFSYLADRGLSPEAAAVTISALSALQIVSRIVFWTPVVARVGVRRVLLLWGSLLCLACVLLALAREPTFAEAAATFLGLAMGGNLVLQLQIWPEYFGRLAVGAIIGMGQMVTGLSSAIVPLLIAAFLDRTASFTGMYVIVAALVFCGLVLHAWAGQPVRPVHGSRGR